MSRISSGSSRLGVLNSVSSKRSTASERRSSVDKDSLDSKKSTKKSSPVSVPRSKTLPGTQSSVSNEVSREQRRKKKSTLQDSKTTKPSSEMTDLEINLAALRVDTTMKQIESPVTIQSSKHHQSLPSTVKSYDYYSIYQSGSFKDVKFNSMEKLEKQNTAMETAFPLDVKDYHPDIQTLLKRPIISRKEILKYQLSKSSVPRGLIGLANIGNTCFMNSILQCIFATNPLMGYFKSDIYKCDINPKSPMRGELAQAFAELVVDVLGGSSNQILTPSHFKSQIERYAPQFAGYRQQDSQEFLRFMLDGLHEDLNRITEKPKWTVKDSEIDKLPDVQKALFSWNRYQSRNSSFIFDLFGGQLQSTVTCIACGYDSITFEMFFDLSLPIPKKYREKFRFTSSGSACNISDCLQEFTQKETLDDSYKCDKCKTSQKATKRLQIYKCPEILVLHLKRFSFSTFSRDKLETVVEFPRKGLDVADSMSDLQGHDLDSVYDLYGVSNHMGGLGGGHYVAHVLNIDNDEWYLKDDSRVSQVDVNFKSMPSAYVLFYKKKNK